MTESVDDDAWIEQLQDAVRRPSEQVPARPVPDQPSEAVPAGPPAEVPVADIATGPATMHADLRLLGQRMATLESLVEDVARQVRRTQPPSPDFGTVVDRIAEAVVARLAESVDTEGPDGVDRSVVEDLAGNMVHAGERLARVADDFDGLIGRLDRSLEATEDAQRAIVDELQMWAADTDDDFAPGDVVLLAREVRHRLGKLEAQQRRLVEDLAVDRRHLVDDAVAEIRALFFGN